MQSTREWKSIKYFVPWITICFAIVIAGTAQALPNSVPRGIENTGPRAIQKSSIQSQPSKSHPKTVEIGLLGAQARVRLVVGDTLRVVVPVRASSASATAADSGWRVTSNDPRVLETQSVQNLPAAGNGNQPGGARTAKYQSLTFLAKAPGKKSLVLKENSPEGKSSSAGEVSIALTVTRASNRLSEPAITPEGKQLASYSGHLPCADCSGIHIRITLYSAERRHQSGGTYVRTMTYLDAPHGDSTFVEAGRWSVEKEKPAKESSPNGKTASPRLIYSLYANGSNHRDRYQRRGDALVPLASDGKPIHSPFNMDLHRQP